MSSLSVFSHEEIEKIISLPFKVGICVSHAEDEDGDDDDEKETLALEKSIKKHANPDNGNTFIWEVAVSTLKQRDQWATWSEDTFTIEAQCEKVVQLVRARLSDADMKAYIRMVTDIATDVAQAYGEFGLPPEEPKGLMGVVKKLLGASSDSGPQPMNVSAAEDETINRITKALRKYAG